MTCLYRRADLAPAVLIIAGISFLAHVLERDAITGISGMNSMCWP